MTDSLNRRKLYDILSRENQRQIEVPIFQRSYSWKNDNWDKLLNDVFLDKSSFMGIVIGVKGGDTTYPKFVLIDGQQRLTTISIFMISIYKRLIELGEEENNEDYIELKSDIKKRLTIKKISQTEPRLVLSLQNTNKNDYEYLINSNIMGEETTNKPQNFGNRRLSYAFKFFSTYCEKEIKSLDDAERIYKELKNLTFVELEENSFSNAFKLFDVLNNRGMPLSAMDIIRNSLFKELHATGIDLDGLEKYNTSLNEIMENLLDSTIQTRFLRQFYMAFKHDKKIKVEKISKATISNIINIYEELAKRDPKYLLNELKHKSQIYKKFISFDNGENFGENYENLLNLGISPAYTFLLYLESNKLFSEENYIKLLNYLRNFFIKRNILDIPPTRELDLLFMGIVEKIEEEKNNGIEEEGLLSSIRETLFKRKELKNDELLKERLKDDIYETNSRMARYLLCLVEESIRNRDSRVNLWEKNRSNQFIFTIEHILPQNGMGKNKEWIKEIETDNEEDFKKRRGKYCHKLGNLTLTTSNSKLSDFNFNKKKNRVDNKKIPIGYNNGFEINKYLLDQDKWNIQKIEERTNFLIDHIIKILNS
jgi:uncharacterized protein with ParB-like and HNH nuclease domain